MPRRLALFAALAVLPLACVPHRDLPPDQIHQFSKGPEFDKLADELHAKAEQLGAAASAKDAKAASDTLASMKATCKACHSKFK